jgi:phospholipid-binding lipoprotein MlaA
MAPGAITVHPAGQTSNSLDDYDDAADDEVIADPLEPWNRFWFRFNNFFYLHVAKPAYQGYAAITPPQLRSGFSNFFHNLWFPVRFVNNILQFRLFEAGVEFGRFFINTTTTLGFANIARDKKTIVPVDPSGEDFGQTLGRWGIGHGFYIVWPFIGPSSPRDTLGRIGDLFADPFFYVSPWELATGSEMYLRFNDLGELLPLYEDMRRAAVDPYIAMRQAYVNYRRVQVNR